MRSRFPAPLVLAGCLLATLPLAGPTAEDPPKALAPKRVTLEGTVPLGKALRALAEQAGIVVESALGPGVEPELKLGLRNVPFWKAVDAVADAAGARVYLYGPGGKILLTRRANTDKALAQKVSHHGIFRVALRRLVVTSDFETGTRGCTASLEVAWEPHFRPFYLETKPQDLVLRGPDGSPVAVPPASGVWVPVDGRRGATVDLSLPALPRSAETIGLLSGALPVRGTSRMLTFDFDTLDRVEAALERKMPPQKTTDGVTVTVSGVKLKGVWAVQMTTELPPGGPEFESFQQWAVNNEIVLRHKDGRTTLRHTGYGSETSGSSRKAVVNYYFENVPRGKRQAGDWAVVYRAPASILEVPIRFEFKDVPLR